MTAASSSAPRTGNDGAGAVPYERFVAAVVAQQLRSWLPTERSRVLDISRSDLARGSTTVSATMGRGGHDVFRVRDEQNRTLPPTATRHPSVRHVIGDVRSLDWFRSERLDAVVAEGSVLSSCLATEATSSRPPACSGRAAGCC